MIHQTVSLGKYWKLVPSTLINHSPNAAFQGQWKKKVARNKTIPFISTCLFILLLCCMQGVVQ